MNNSNLTMEIIEFYFSMDPFCREKLKNIIFNGAGWVYSDNNLINLFSYDEDLISSVRQVKNLQQKENVYCIENWKYLKPNKQSYSVGLSLALQGSLWIPDDAKDLFRYCIDLLNNSGYKVLDVDICDFKLSLQIDDNKISKIEIDSSSLLLTMLKLFKEVYEIHHRTQTPSLSDLNSVLEIDESFENSPTITVASDSNLLEYPFQTYLDFPLLSNNLPDDYIGTINLIEGKFHVFIG